MHRVLICIATTVAVSSFLTVPTRAQDLSDAPTVAQDWVLSRVPDRDAVLAVAEFNNGITLVSRCVDGAYDVSVSGLPPARGTSRTLQIAVGDGDFQDTGWTTANEPTSAFSRVPAPLARRMAKGGTIQIVVPGANGQPRTRFVLETGPSPQALEATLTACGRPLADPRDRLATGFGQDGLPEGFRWVRAPRVDFPEPTRGRIPTTGTVTMTCVTTLEGRLDDCIVESEHPAGFKLGKEALDAMPSSRVGRAERNQPMVAGFTVQFSVNFALQN